MVFALDWSHLLYLHADNKAVRMYLYYSSFLALSHCTCKALYWDVFYTRRSSAATLSFFFSFSISYLLLFFPPRRATPLRLRTCESWARSMEGCGVSMRGDWVEGCFTRAKTLNKIRTHNRNGTMWRKTRQARGRGQGAPSLRYDGTTEKKSNEELPLNRIRRQHEQGSIMQLAGLLALLTPPPASQRRGGRRCRTCQKGFRLPLRQRPWPSKSVSLA